MFAGNILKRVICDCLYIFSLDGTFGSDFFCVSHNGLGTISRNQVDNSDAAQRKLHLIDHKINIRRVNNSLLGF